MEAENTKEDMEDVVEDVRKECDDVRIQLVEVGPVREDGVQR